MSGPITHGMSNHCLYNVWKKMIHRCHHPYHHKYPSYGGRGIEVCPSWRGDFAQFVADVGQRPTPTHTLDRIDPNGPYAPRNVRWATAQEQARNRRDTIWVEFCGEKTRLIDLADVFTVSYSTARYRILRGWAVEAALYHAPGLRPGHIERDTPRLWAECFPNGMGDCYLR